MEHFVGVVKSWRGFATYTVENPAVAADAASVIERPPNCVGCFYPKSHPNLTVRLKISWKLTL